MLGIYWGCLITGVSIAFVTFIFSELIGSLFDGILDFFSMDNLEFLNPMVVFGGLTVFGATGVLLTQYTSINTITVAVISILTAILLSALTFFFYVKPMQNAENSTAFSMQELSGKIGEVITPIPAKGYGEVFLRVGVGNTNQIASSFDQIEIQAGEKVVVVEVIDGVLSVSRFEDKLNLNSDGV